MGLRRFALLGLLVASVAYAAAVHYEDNQLHVFPGGLSGPGVGFNVIQAGADPFGGLDSTPAFQAAIDSGATKVHIPAGIYNVCTLNTIPVILRSSNQTIEGEGPQTIINCGSACTSGCFLGAPAPPNGVGAVQYAHDVIIQDMMFTGGGSGVSYINFEGDDNQRITIRRVTADVGQPSLTTSLGANFILFQGASHVEISDNKCFSSSVGRGNCINWQRGGTDIRVLRNRFSGVAKGLIITANPDASSTTQTEEVTSNIEVGGNFADGMWYTAPAINTCGAGTSPCVTTGTTYGASSVTVAGLTIGGLCSGTLSGTCAATTTCTTACPGSIMRTMVPVLSVSDAASSFFSGGRIKSPSIDWSATTAQAGDVIRTNVSLCNGNGTLPDTTFQNTCTGGAGLAGWGDSCTCTANADCSSNICEPRFAIVSEVVTIQVAGGPACTSTNKCEVMVEEWLSDSTRLPVSAPPTGTAYTLFDPIISQVHDFNAGTGVINICVGNCIGSMNSYRTLIGANTTPTNGQTLEILTPRPGYTFMNTDASVREVDVHDNTSLRSFSDGLSTFGYRFSIHNNTIRDGSDVCMTVNGSHHSIFGNRMIHCGSQGAFYKINDSIVEGNEYLNNVWTNPNSGTVPQGDMTINGSNRTLFAHNHMERILNLGNAKYGLALSGAGNAADSNILDDNTIRGSYVTSAYRLDNASATNTHIKNWNGEAITLNAAGTWSVEGGLVAFASFPPTTNLSNGSYFGCSDCTVANPCAGAGTGAFAKRQGGAFVCN